MCTQAKETAIRQHREKVTKAGSPSSFGHVTKALGKRKASSPKGGKPLTIRKPSVNVGGATSSPSAAPKKRKSTLNTGSNSGGSSGVGANLNV